MQPNLTRRNALKLSGAASAAALGAGLFAVNPAGAAHVAGSYTFADPNAVSNETGDISFVSVVAGTDIQWDGFELPVTHVGFSEVVEVTDGGVGGTTLDDPKVYWGQAIADLSAAHPKPSSDPNVGNSGSPYELDASNPDHQPGREGGIQSGGENEQVLFDENGDGSRSGSAITTEPLQDDSVFEPAADGETKTVTVIKTEFAHLYHDDGSSLVLLHPDNQSWAPGAAEVVGSFDVTVENQPASTDGSTGTDESTSAG